MNFIGFTGHKKTTDSFLNKIKQISTTPTALYDNLNSLSIFESFTPIKNKISLEEASNSIKMKMSSKGTKSLSVKFPNIFGNGEFLNINASGINDIKLDFGRPFFFNSQLHSSKISLIKDQKVLNDKTIDIRRAEVTAKRENTIVKIGTERIQNLMTFYGQYLYSLAGFRIDSKVGYTKTDKIIPFCKLVVARSFKLEGKRMFFDSNLRIGKIFGQTNLIEKFFLGNNLGGYKNMSIGPVSQNKKLGGNSFIEIKNKAGVFLRGIELFAFADVGVNSIKGIRECGEILAKFEDNNCIGKSVGVGVSLKNKKGPSFIFSVPLTSNPEAEKYSFGIDFEF